MWKTGLGMVLIGLLGLSAAQAQEKVEKPARITTSFVKTGAIVEAVDKETRQIKLIGPDGRRFSVIARDEVRNFDQIDPRDRVVLEYAESIAIVVRPQGSKPLEGQLELIDVAAPGEKPRLAGLETRAVTATLVALDRTSRRATLQLPDGSTRAIRTAPNARLDLVDVGDEVTAVITQAFAISVVEPETD